MKCKRHPYEAGSGVCASCLRERLLDVLAAQTARPDPILFPSSLSPHRRSDDSAAPRRHLLFFSTPQVGPSRSRLKRSFLSSLLFSHHQSEEPDSNPPIAKRSGAIYWISTLIPRRRRTLRTKTTKPVEASIRVCEGDTVSENGYSTETSGISREAMPTPMRIRNQNRHSRGLSMCLSPLFREAPSGRKFQAEAAAAVEVGLSDELRRETRREDLGLKQRSRLARFGTFR
ncbi:uncharacterized protein LOC120283650 [Dioscorea cayenensis subsp. rotundata]|uniref:Uncharacterized protein LOC120283650 n=1 Tax=Dioscorea cayennensis subsp. rotundata TaxID=55577 RepID=A0AB40D7L1_DIOCR|nr:uncharacterized protein LOC120283650 [Dioscorea cayenensis subsp. rotundata]